MNPQPSAQIRFPDLPEGTVTFLFTDIEGSTQLLHKLREQYASLLADQRRLLREAFANWLISPKNPWFARNVVNRVWFWLLGLGMIHSADDIRPDNPPAHPELLAFLEQDLIAARYDLKHLYRQILNSTTYQLSCVPRSDEPRGEANFAHYPLRRLEAEVLIDALCQITGTRTGTRRSGAASLPAASVALLLWG